MNSLLQFSCEICFQSFDEISRIPKFMSCCGKTYCDICCQNLRRPVDIVQCPNCKQRTIYSSLKKNLTLISFINSYKPQASQSQTTSSLKKCSIHDKETSLYCYTCKSKMCHRCWGDHDKTHQPESIEKVIKDCQDLATDWQEFVNQLANKANLLKLTIEEGKKINSMLINDLIDEKINKLAKMKENLMKGLDESYRAIDIEKYYKISNETNTESIDIRSLVGDLQSKLRNIADDRVIDAIDSIEKLKTKINKEELQKWLLEDNVATCKEIMDNVISQPNEKLNFEFEDISSFEISDGFIPKKLVEKAISCTQKKIIFTKNHKAKTYDILQVNKLDKNEAKIILWNYEKIFDVLPRLQIDLTNDISMVQPIGNNIMFLILNFSSFAVQSIGFQQEILTLLKNQSQLRLLELNFHRLGFTEVLGKLGSCFKNLRFLRSFSLNIFVEGYSSTLIFSLLESIEKYLTLLRFELNYNLNDEKICKALTKIFENCKQPNHLSLKSYIPKHLTSHNSYLSPALKPIKNFKTLIEINLLNHVIISQEYIGMLIEVIINNKLRSFRLDFALPQVMLSNEILSLLWNALAICKTIEVIEVKGSQFTQFQPINYQLPLCMKALADLPDLKELHLTLKSNSKYEEVAVDREILILSSANYFKNLQSISVRIDGNKVANQLDYILFMIEESESIRSAKFYAMAIGTDLIELIHVFGRNVTTGMNGYELCMDKSSVVVNQTLLIELYPHLKVEETDSDVYIKLK